MNNFGPYGSTGYNNAYGYFPAQGYQYQPQQNFQVNQNQVPMIRGGIVNGEADIYPNMVFQDGSTSYFPVKDGSAHRTSAILAIRSIRLCRPLLRMIMRTSVLSMMSWLLTGCRIRMIPSRSCVLRSRR